MLQARHYTPTTGRQIDLIVIHDMEAPEGPQTAENVASWFAGPNAPQASAHWCFDNDSAVRCVLDKDVAWHAPGANHNGLGYEHAGYARQTRDEWLDDYGRAMLSISAGQARQDCALYAIPIQFVDVDGLLRGERGVTTHAAVSKAFRRSTHWDPGDGFPMDYYLELVAGGTVTVPGSGPIAGGGALLRVGSRGKDVTAWQTVLHGAGLLDAAGVDGIFGPVTAAATEIFQGQLGVAADGIVGPETRAATARLLAWLAAQRPVPAEPPFPGTVRRGSTGPAVRAVQDRLRDRGWSIAVDGSFGPATDAVVRAFQAEKGLQVDGIAGPATWHALWTAPVT